MPITKHHQKKYPHSEWVRRRNIRRAAARQALKPSSSGTVEPIKDFEKPSVETSLPSPSPKQKGFIKKSMDAIQNVFARPGKKRKDAA